MSGACGQVDQNGGFGKCIHYLGECWLFCGAGPSGSQFPHGSKSSFVLAGFLHLGSRWFLLLILLSTLYLALQMKDFLPLC